MYSAIGWTASTKNKTLTVKIMSRLPVSVMASAGSQPVCKDAYTLGGEREKGAKEGI